MRRLGRGAAVIMSMAMVASGVTFVHGTTEAKETNIVRYEAENAEIFVKGSATDDYKIDESENYSGGKAVGNMNTWPDDGRSYCETKVYVKAAGTYSMTIGYAGGEENHPCNIDVRVNEGEWQSALAYPTAGWDTVGTTTLNIELQAGENVIDVTGACNIWYEGMGWEWINLDYFELEYIGENIEKGVRYEAEDAIEFVKGSADNDYKLEESENYSGGKAIGKMDTWPDNGRAYCVTKVNADVAGTYLMTIGYAGGEENHPCNIDVRINNGEWKSVLALPTAGWDTVGTATLKIELQAGENTIDVTGACNIWYEGMGWEWINLDYFELAKIADEPEIPTDETTVARKDETTSVKPEEKTTAPKATKAAVKAPGRATIKKAQNVKGKKAKISLKKVARAKGYQIQYSRNKKMKKAKSVYSKKLTYTVKKLKKKKTYYFRARAYVLDGKAKKYGKWSRVKTLKIKK